MSHVFFHRQNIELKNKGVKVKRKQEERMMGRWEGRGGQ
jgi:hypothetical protein